MDYFQFIVERLTIEEIAVLGILFDKESTAAFKAVRRNEVHQMSGMSVAHFRKTMGRLMATHMVNVVSGGKEHKIFLTGFGMAAISKSLEEAEG